MGRDLLNEMRRLSLDDGESIFFARELEHILSRQFNIEYPELRARMFIPVSNEAGPGAESITYYQFDQVGMAKLISDYSSDLPKVDVFGDKFTSPVESLGVAFGWSIQEVQSAAMAGRSLTTMKANTARRAHEQRVDEIAALGDANTGMVGMLNNANVPVGSALNGAWALATPDQILEDLNESVQTIINTSNNVESPDTVLLPPAEYAIINQRRLGDTETTVLKFFLANNPWIRNVDHWYRLNGAGAGATQRMVTYRRSPDKLELQIPKEFETLPVQERGLMFEVPTHSRIGGVTVYKPLSLLYRDGI